MEMIWRVSDQNGALKEANSFDWYCHLNKNRRLDYLVPFLNKYVACVVLVYGQKEKRKIFKKVYLKLNSVIHSD